jgi:Uncharacterised protein family UPF0564
MPSNQYGAANKTGESNFKITRPEPYRFDSREKEKGRSLSIRARKLKEMIDEKEAEEKANVE